MVVMSTFADAKETHYGSSRVDTRSLPSGSEHCKECPESNNGYTSAIGSIKGRTPSQPAVYGSCGKERCDEQARDGNEHVEEHHNLPVEDRSDCSTPSCTNTRLAVDLLELRL